MEVFADILFFYLPTFQKAEPRPAQPTSGAQPRWSSVFRIYSDSSLCLPLSIRGDKCDDLSPPLSSGESHSESGVIFDHSYQIKALNIVGARLQRQPMQAMPE